MQLVSSWENMSYNISDRYKIGQQRKMAEEGHWKWTLQNGGNKNPLIMLKTVLKKEMKVSYTFIPASPGSYRNRALYFQ